MELMTIVWNNLTSLMQARWGVPNINRLAREAHVGVATVQRIKDGGTSVGIDVLAKVAKVFNVPVWQLLLPSLDPRSPPMLITDAAEQRAVRQMLVAAEQLAEYKAAH